MSPSAIRAANESPHELLCPFINGIRRLAANEILKPAQVLGPFTRSDDYDEEVLKDAISEIEAPDMIIAANVINLNKYQLINPNACTAGMKAALRDFQLLQSEVKDLKVRCQVLLNRLVSTLSLEESRKSIEQSNSTKQLTQLAYVFLPLSLSASVFGMNTRELRDPRLWMFFATSAVLLLASLIFWFVVAWISTLDTYRNLLNIGKLFLVLLKLFLIAPAHATTIMLFALCHTTSKSLVVLVHIGVAERLWSKKDAPPLDIDLYRCVGQESRGQRFWLRKVLEVQSFAATPGWCEKYFWQRSRRQQAAPQGTSPQVFVSV